MVDMKQQHSIENIEAKRTLELKILRLEVARQLNKEQQKETVLAKAMSIAGMSEIQIQTRILALMNARGAQYGEITSQENKLASIQLANIETLKKNLESLALEYRGGTEIEREDIEELLDYMTWKPADLEAYVAKDKENTTFLIDNLKHFSEERQNAIIQGLMKQKDIPEELKKQYAEALKGAVGIEKIGETTKDQLQSVLDWDFSSQFWNKWLNGAQNAISQFKRLLTGQPVAPQVPGPTPATPTKPTTNTPDMNTEFGTSKDSYTRQSSSLPKTPVMNNASAMKAEIDAMMQKSSWNEKALQKKMDSIINFNDVWDPMLAEGTNKMDMLKEIISSKLTEAGTTAGKAMASALAENFEVNLSFDDLLKNVNYTKLNKNLRNNGL